MVEHLRMSHCAASPDVDDENRQNHFDCNMAIKHISAYILNSHNFTPLLITQVHSTHACTTNLSAA